MMYFVSVSTYVYMCVCMCVCVCVCDIYTKYMIHDVFRQCQHICIYVWTFESRGRRIKRHEVVSCVCVCVCVSICMDLFKVGRRRIKRV